MARKTIRMVILNKILIAKQYICPVKPVDTFEEGCAIELAEAIEASRKLMEGKSSQWL
ncbi:hypothetical protein [Pantoea stewartii]|uniref:hypothetical protein n=1 Tax=Pantoea stewartii TaxID=66269 RepID=UPI00147834AC|nr:hypothetical protein [Pantoea stewartii]